MNSYPKISIVTPCFNHEAYIAETIESILSQDYPNLEYVVIDDGSTDKSWDIIQRYKDDLTYLERLDGYRETPVHAINYGFSKTDGEIMNWVNSKNLVMPGRLFTVAEIFTQFPNVEWITGLSTTINENGQIIRVYPHRKNKYDFAVGDWSVIQQESTFWKRSLWQRVGQLDEKHKVGFDVGLWAQFFQHAELYHVDSMIGAYRKTQNALSVRKKDEYNEYAQKATHELANNFSSMEKSKLNIYRSAYVFRKVLRNIPDRWWMRTPIFYQFSHPLIQYKQKDQKWRISFKNPFKTSF